MGTVSRVHTFASGAILTAAQLNNEFDNLLTSSAINGGLDATNLGVTAGQATASKALVVDASRNLADATGSNRINNLALSGTFESTGAITATAGITSGGNIVSDTDSTDDLGTTGVRWANLFVDDITVTNNVTIGGTLTLTGGITLNGNTTIGDSSADTLTVNSTVTSNLIFTDNTYDIGASGATRPRDLHLSRNALMGGTLGVTGLITATGGVSGALTGNVTGNVTGDVTGNLTGNVTGNVTGNLTGDVTGNISGNVTGGTISGTTGTFSSAVTVNDTIRLDTGDTTVSDGDVFGDVEFYDNDGGSASAGVTARIQAVATGNYGASDILFSTSSSSGGARTALTERVKITSAGLLGLGTSSPSSYSFNNDARLVVANTSANSTISIVSGTSSSGYLSFADGTTGTDRYSGNIQYNHSTNTMSFKTGGGVEAMTINSAQDLAVDGDTLYIDASTDRVGINTASSNYPLQVMGEVFAGVMSGFETAGKFYLGRGDGTGTDVRYHYVEANNSTTDSSNYLSFNVHTGATSTSTAQVLRLQGNSRVGINETSPSTLLHVTEGGEPPAEGMLILEANSSSRQLRIQPPTNSDNGFFDARGGNMTFLDDGTEIFRYNASTISTSTGINVGIGEAAPTATLTVAPTAHDAGVPAVWLHSADNAADHDGTVISSVNNGSDAEVLHVRTNNTTYNNGTSLMLVRGDGNVGISTDSPSYKIHSIGAAGTASSLALEESTSGAARKARLQQNSGAAILAADGTSNSLIIETAGSEAIRIDSSQRVGIGASSPTSGYSLDIANSGSANVYIRTTASSDTASSLAIEGYRTNGSAGYLSRIEAKNRNGSVAITQIDSETESVYNSGALVFKTASTGTVAERARIQSGGQVSINSTAINGQLNVAAGNSTVDGTANNATRDVAYVMINSTAGAAALRAEHNGGNPYDGDMVVFNQFYDGSNYTWKERLRVLSSGGITFNGDTSTANALDDYEEGTWTPTIIATTTNPTVGYSVQYGRYTKVGNIVTVELKIDLSSFSGGSGGINISGLPFTSNSDSNYRSAGPVSFARNVTNGGGAIMLNLGPNVTRVSLIKYTNADNYDTNVAPSDLASTSIIHAAMTYEAQ